VPQWNALWTVLLYHWDYDIWTMHEQKWIRSPKLSHCWRGYALFVHLLHLKLRGRPLRHFNSAASKATGTSKHHNFDVI
jgi:hypothetical protein